MNLEIYQIDAFTSKPFGGNPAAVVPLTEWLPVNSRSVISGTGRTKLRMTWLMTSAFVVSVTQAATMIVGSIVTSRRTQSGMRQSTKSCMMTWPAIVPTTELERPEASSDTMKIVADMPPNNGPSMW